LKHLATEELERLYTVERLTGRQIAELVGVSNRTVLRKLKAAGIQLRNPGYEAIPQLADREWLTEQYVTNHKSTPQIAADIGCGSRSVAHALKRLGIEARSTGSEMGHVRNSSEETREKHSKARRGRYIGEDNPNWKGGSPFVDPDRNRYPSKAWVKAVKDRDGWKCVECGATDSLHAHHIKRWRDHPALRYDVDNGKTLCHPCHEEAHGRGFKFRWFKKSRKPTSASAL